MGKIRRRGTALNKGYPFADGVRISFEYFAMPVMCAKTVEAGPSLWGLGPM